MYELYYYPGNASLLPHFMLEEIGAAFQLHLVDRTQNEHKSSAYLKLNPRGLIPVLVHGETVLSETAAIALYLSDTHPEAKLAPDFATPQRALFYKWLMYLASTVHPETVAYYYPQRFTQDPHGADRVKAAFEQRVIEMFQFIEAHLAQGGPYILGQNISFLDHYLLMLARWARNMKMPPRQMKHIGASLARVFERPAVQRALETEKLPAPFY